jgi:lysophospholipid acyltransferase (LPLAT)-like uncharacterized protein
MPGLGARIGRWFRQAELGLKFGILLGAGYIWLANATTRWRVEGKDRAYAAIAEAGGALALIWHGRLFMAPVWAPRNLRTVAMISANRDGDLISGIVGRWGVETIRGSSYDHVKKRGKGGVRAYLQAREELDKGDVVVAISPDGPRGPRMRLKPGAAQVAIETQRPVILMTYSVAWAMTTRGWDRFMIPLPFGRGLQLYSEPIFPPEAKDDETIQAFSLVLETQLNEMTQRADSELGRRRINPEANRHNT